MKRNELKWIVMTLFIAACAAAGCAAPVEPVGDELAGDDGVRAFVLDAERSPIYEVGIELDGTTSIVQVRPTAELRARILDAGFKGLHGEEAVAAFLTALTQQRVDETGEVPEGVLIVADRKGDPSERAPSSVGVPPPVHGVCYYTCTTVWCNAGQCHQNCVVVCT